jgi:hypothetical protein
MNNAEKVTYNDALKKTVDNIRNSVPTLITGRAGTGKSHLIKDLKKKFPRLCLMAPTNVAAKNIGGRTIHKTFHLPNNIYPDNIPNRFKNRRTNVIDEVSMVGWNLFQQIVDYSGDKSNYVLLGDFGQFSPVRDEPILPFLENNPDITKLELTQNFRQKNDLELLQILDDLRESGRPTDSVMQFVKSRTIKSRTDIVLPKEIVYLSTLNTDVNAYNEQFNIYDIGTLVRGHNNRNRIKNNEMGVVTGFSDGLLSIRLFHGGEILSKSLEIPENARTIDVSPDDVTIAEGMTLHKSQGKDFPNVLINLNQIWRFPAGLYVAMSRVRRGENIFFIDWENKSSKFTTFSKNTKWNREGGGAGVNEIKKGQQQEEGNGARQKGGVSADKNCAYTKKSLSNTRVDSMLLLNEYYVGKNKNGGFTESRRNKLLQKLGLKKRTNVIRRDQHGLFQKEKYEFDEVPENRMPFFVYTLDYRLNSKEVSVFESLNPMKPGTPLGKRNKGNCYSQTRFLFEIDHHEKLPRRKKAELMAYDLAFAKRLKKKGIVNRITFTGNAGYHCIVETLYEVPDYKAFWHWMNKKYFGGKADKECASPAFWTRTPGVKRPGTGKIQRGYGIGNFVFDPTEELAEMEREMEKKTKETVISKPAPKNRKEKVALAVEINKADIQKRITGTKSKMKPEAQELLDGSFPFDGFIEWAKIAINCLHGLGYSPDVIWVLLGKAGKDKKGRDRRDKVKGFVFNNRKNRH